MSANRRTSTRGDRLKQLRAFCHAARLGSITRAAEYIYSSQPAVSQQVRALEDELSLVLFDRRGPRIALTLAGEKLYRMAMPVVVGMDRLPDTFAEQYRGEISGDFQIAAGRSTAAYVVPRYLKEFREQHPGIRVNVRTGTGLERLSWLRAYEVDIAFGAVDVVPPDLDFHLIFGSRNILITPVDHPLAGRDDVDIREAGRYPAVVPRGDSRYIRRVADLILRQHGVALKVAAELDGWNVIKRYVAAGVGVSVVPEVCLTERDRVWKVPFDRYFPNRRYGVIMRRNESPSLAAERFVRIMDPAFRGRS